MANPPELVQPTRLDPQEEQFRSESRKHSFRNAVYNGVGVAALFAVLGQGMKLLMDAAGAGAGAAGGMSAEVGLVMAGVAALGTAALWMANKESTELRCLQDDHQARRNLEIMGNAPKLAQGRAPEPTKYPQFDNPDAGRGDGKLWTQATVSQQAARAI